MNAATTTFSPLPVSDDETPSEVELSGSLACNDAAKDDDRVGLHAKPSSLPIQPPGVAGAEETRKAYFLMLLSALLASFMSLDLGYLGETYSPPFTLLINGCLGTAVMVCRRLREIKGTDLPFFGSPALFRWLVLRGLLGGVTSLGGYVGMSQLTISDASTIMFQMPMITSLLGWLVLRQLWRRRHTAVTALSLLGVIFIVKPTSLFGSGTSSAPGNVGFGLAGAFTAAFSGSAANIVMNSRIRGESTVAVTLYQQLASLALAIPGMIFVSRELNPPSHLVDQHGGIRFLALCLVSMLNISFHFCRNISLQISNHASVTNVLYCEIVFAFAWDFLILGSRVGLLSFVGASLIILGSIVGTWLQLREEAKSLVPDGRDAIGDNGATEDGATDDGESIGDVGKD